MRIESLMSGRVLEYECKNFRVKLSKPKNLGAFMEALTVLQKEKRKAEHVLLDEIE